MSTGKEGRIINFREAQQYRGCHGPIRWFGGKGRLTSKLKQLLPNEWATYVEPFFGGGALFFSLPPAGQEVVADVDPALIGLYRVLQDPESFRRFQSLARFTPYSRRLIYECQQVQGEDPVERAWAWWVSVRQSFGGIIGSGWGSVVGSGTWEKGAQTSGGCWLPVVRRLSAIHERLQGVQVRCDNALSLLPDYLSDKQAFIYLDPPYVPETRRARKYKYDMGREEHEHLLELLVGCSAQVMLSGYDSDLYKALEEEGWNRTEFEVVCHFAGYTRANRVGGKGAGRKRQPRTEVVWRNYRRTGESGDRRLPLREVLS